MTTRVILTIFQYIFHIELTHIRQDTMSACMGVLGTAIRCMLRRLEYLHVHCRWEAGRPGCKSLEGTVSRCHITPGGGAGDAERYT